MAARKRITKSARKLPLSLAAALLLAGGWYAVPSLFAVVEDGGGADFSNQAAGKYSETDRKLRGNIYDRDLRQLAVSLPLISVYAKPVEIRLNAEKMANLAVILKMDPAELQSALKSERSIVWLARSLSPGTAEELKRLRAAGIYLVEDMQRYYPQGETGAQVVGCYRDGHGLAGLEFSYDFLLGTNEPNAAAGNHLILNLDVELQQSLEHGFRKLKKRFAAGAVYGAILEPGSGAVLALANSPGYDPNHFWDYNEDSLVNRVVEDPVELGSFMELFRFAAWLEKDSASQEKEKAGEPQPKKEWQMVQEGELVSPPFASLLARMPQEVSGQDGKRFFGKKNDSANLPASCESLATKREGDTMMEVSAMQLLSGFAALVNGGRLHSPHFLRAIDGTGGSFDREKESDGVEVLTSEAGQKMRALLLSEHDRGSLFISLQKGGRGEGEVQGQTIEAIRQELREEKRADVLLLGYYPGKKGQSVIAVVVRDALFDVKCQDILEKTAAGLLRQAALETAKSVAQATEKKLAVDVLKTYDGWSKLQESHGVNTEQGNRRQKHFMPSVTGRSLRKALQDMQQLGVRISVKGTGIVVKQDPPAGTLLKSGQAFLLLRSDG
jgi:cell division protein FtsI (penicillin-binding protein 3)